MTGKKHLTWEEAFEQEKEVLNERRDAARPVCNDMVGVAFSGGGIRSATFGLGVLEALKELSLLKKIDYLSTVSGGGYIGAWLSVNCKRAAERSVPSVDWLDKDTPWKESITYLRRYSNYLSPTLGFFSADTWSMGTVWLRNTILVQLTLLLAIALALLVPRLLFVGFRNWQDAGNWRWVTICLFAIGAAGVAANQWRLNQDNLPFKTWPKGLSAAAFCGAMAVACGIYFNFQPFTTNAIDYRAALPIAILMMLAAFWMQPFVMKLLHWHKRGEEKVNYGQTGVQLVVVIPMMAVGFLVAAIMWGECKNGSLSQIEEFGGFFTQAWRYWPFPLTVVFASLLLFSFCSIHSLRGWKNKLVMALAPVPAMLVLHALLCAIMLLFHSWAGQSAHGEWKAYVWGPAMVLYSFTLTIVVLLGMLGRQSTEGAREWWSRFGAWLGIYGLAWMVINVTAAYAPAAGDFVINKDLWKKVSFGWIATTLAGLLAGGSGSTGGKAARSPGKKLLELVAQVAPFICIGGLLLGVSYVTYIAINLNSQTPENITGGNAWDRLLASDTKASVWGLALCLISFLLLAWRVDINEFSLNAFYRNRLVRCYLGATRFRPGERDPQNFTGFDDDDDMKLTALASAPAGPFHIVNCALNLGGSSDLALHTRHSAIFTLTPLHCGSYYLSRDPRTNEISEIGYTPTTIFRGHESQPTLGEAISVSGAAASPNMGYHTSPVVAFLLTMFDVRLGCWFPNPRMHSIKKPSPGFSLRYLIMELFGGADDKSNYLAISDGGHFENLGVYELVKRRCRVIIVSDAECDSDLHFEGLGTLIRVCQVDFGAEIDIDVRPIHPAKKHGWSDSRFAVGTIKYQDGSSGTLIYLKASMTGEEDTSVLQYKSAHPTFPHESTSNQFYKEDQFESYRRLGYDIATQVFRPVHREVSFMKLAERLAAVTIAVPQAVGRG